MRKTSFLSACLLSLGCEVIGFVPKCQVRSRNLSVRWDSKLFGPGGDFDEGKQVKEGEALAKQFYEQLRKREESQSQSTPSGGEIRDSEIATGNTTEAPPRKKKKFTGQPPEPAKFGNDAGIFGRSNQQGPRSPREQMMRREFDLVNRAEKGLALQAVLAVCILILYLYVGLTGGIQSGVDDFDMGADDTIIDGLVLPERSDQEASYWL